MEHGGTRAGAGRPKGAANFRTREVAERAAAEGVMPLEVMLRTMREHWDAGRHDEAARVAKDAAPYVHARLAAIEHTGADGGPIEVISKQQRDAAVMAALRADT